MEGRILCIDYGHKRVGLALSDPLQITAQPYRICGKKEFFGLLKELMLKEQVIKIVVGLPLSMDGNESRKTEEVREFAEGLKERVSVGVEFFDERLSTRSVDRMLIEEADMSRDKRKKVRDKLAASLILQGYLDSRRG